MAKHYCSICDEDVKKSDYCFKCGLCKQHCICQPDEEETIEQYENKLTTVTWFDAVFVIGAVVLTYAAMYLTRA